MFDLNQDEFDKLSDQHQLFANSLGESGVKINLNSYNLEKLVKEGFDEIDEEHIILLTEQWSLNSDNLFDMEERECVIGDIN